jgi:Domain of unknown function (DUF6089)
MKTVCLILLALVPYFSYSQKLHTDFFGGVANYQGDLQGKRFTFNQAGGAFGVGLSYDISNHFIARTALTVGKISGNDKTNTTAKGVEFRNLNFKSVVTELQLGFEYNLLDLSERSLTPYIFGSVAVFDFNPFTTDSGGRKTFLQPLGTEGQGLPQYPNRKKYKTTQFSIPFGGGVKLALSEKLLIGVEVGLRKTFTDYLDDVSTTYVDEITLLAARGPKAVELAYRGDEVGGPAYPADGSQRGGEKFKDWYYFTGIRVSYLLPSSNSSNFGNKKIRGSKLGCPSKVF